MSQLLHFLIKPLGGGSEKSSYSLFTPFWCLIWLFFFNFWAYWSKSICSASPLHVLQRFDLSPNRLHCTVETPSISRVGTLRQKLRHLPSHSCVGKSMCCVSHKVLKNCIYLCIFFIFNYRPKDRSPLIDKFSH